MWGGGGAERERERERERDRQTDKQREGGEISLYTIIISAAKVSNRLSRGLTSYNVYLLLHRYRARRP